MANPRDDDATIGKVYAQLSDEAYDAEDANRVRAARQYLDCVRAERKPPVRLLDVGCATGFFAAAASRAGYDVVGADASAWMIDRARSRCPHAAFTVGTFESLNFSTEFDVMTLWDVLEHVHSPRNALARAREWLKPTGILVMSMPNSTSLVARLMGSRWVLLLREHLWYFSPDTVAQLLRQCGFEFIRARPKFVQFSIANISRRLAQYGGMLNSLRFLSDSHLLRRVSIRFPMGEMNVVARKV